MTLEEVRAVVAATEYPPWLTVEVDIATDRIITEFVMRVWHEGRFVVDRFTEATVEAGPRAIQVRIVRSYLALCEAKFHREKTKA